MKKEIIDILHGILNRQYRYIDNHALFGIWCDNTLLNMYNTCIIISPYNVIIHYDELSDIEVILLEIAKYCPTIMQHLRNKKLKDLIK